jgi:hypothetical protein
MPTLRRRAATALPWLAVALAVAGCGKAGGQAAAGGPTRRLAPVTPQGAVSVASRNTTRIGGADTAADAAAVARTVYPGLTPATRPGVVALVNDRNWAAALTAAVLAGAPTGAPLLYSDGESLPAVSLQSLEAMHPTGASALGGAQVISIGTSAPLPAGLLREHVAVGEPAVTAAAVERVLVRADGGTAPRAVIVLAANTPHTLQMPAAGLAAESGAPILFVTHARVPEATVRVLQALARPTIYVLDPAVVGLHTLAELGRLGTVTTIGNPADPPPSPVANAISVARFTDGTFGWGVKEPGHGLVFANPGRPLDAAAAAPLSASGDYGPLLLLEASGALPAQLSSYLADIQPAYTNAPQFRPVRGVYNHGWLMGDELAIPAVTQAEIDALLEISPRRQSSEEAAVAQAE